MPANGAPMIPPKPLSPKLNPNASGDSSDPVRRTILSDHVGLIDAMKNPNVAAHIIMPTNDVQMPQIMTDIPTQNTAAA